MPSFLLTPHSTLTKSTLTKLHTNEPETRNLKTENCHWSLCHKVILSINLKPIHLYKLIAFIFSLYSYNNSLTPEFFAFKQFRIIVLYLNLNSKTIYNTKIYYSVHISIINYLPIPYIIFT